MLTKITYAKLGTTYTADREGNVTKTIYSLGADGRTHETVFMMPPESLWKILEKLQDAN